MSDEKVAPNLEELTKELGEAVSSFRKKYEQIKSRVALLTDFIRNSPREVSEALRQEQQDLKNIIYEEIQDEKGVQVKDLFVDAAVRADITAFTQSFTRNPNNQPIPDRKAWYLDPVIDLLSKIDKDNNPNTPVNYVNATYPARVLNSHDDLEQPRINLARNNGITIIPLNVSDSLRKEDNIWEQVGAHWVSLIINHTTKTIYYYDPKYPELKFGDDKDMTFIAFINALGVGTYDVQTIFPQIQQNDYDCGPIAIEVNQYILQKGDVNEEILIDITNQLQNGGIQQKAEELRIEDIKKLLEYFLRANKSLDLTPAPNAIPTPNRGQAAPAIPSKVATATPRAMDSAAVSPPNSFLSNISTFIEMLYNWLILPIINFFYPSSNIPQATTPAPVEANVPVTAPAHAVNKDVDGPTSEVVSPQVVTPTPTPTPNGRAG